MDTGERDTIEVNGVVESDGNTSFHIEVENVDSSWHLGEDDPLTWINVEVL